MHYISGEEYKTLLYQIISVNQRTIKTRFLGHVKMYTQKYLLIDHINYSQRITLEWCRLNYAPTDLCRFIV